MLVLSNISIGAVQFCTYPFQPIRINLWPNEVSFPSLSSLSIYLYLSHTSSNFFLTIILIGILYFLIYSFYKNQILPSQLNCFYAVAREALLSRSILSTAIIILKYDDIRVTLIVVRSFPRWCCLRLQLQLIKSYGSLSLKRMRWPS